MAFIDPSFSSDLDLNPWIQNSHPSDNQDTSIAFTAENTTMESRDSGFEPLYSSSNGFSESDDTSDFEAYYSNSTHDAQATPDKKEAPNPFVPSQSTSKDLNIGERLIGLAMNPESQLSASLDLGRLARLQVIAEEIQRENTARDERKKDEKRSLNENEKNTINEGVYDFLLDPNSDLDISDPGQFRRVCTLAQSRVESDPSLLISENGPLVQTLVIASENAPSLSSDEESESLFEDMNGEPSTKAKPVVKEQVIDSVKEMGIIHQVCSKVKDCLTIFHPEMDPNRYGGSIANAYNAQPNHQAILLENVLRATSDTACRTVDLGLRAISAVTPWEYSSSDFLDQHLCGPTENSFEANFGYWTGVVVAEMISLKGSGILVGKGAQLSGKLIKAAQKAGVKAATIAKLTTGGIGQGISPFVNPRISSIIPNAGRLASQNPQLKTPFIYVIEAARAYPSLAQRTPQVANLITNTAIASSLLGRQIINLATLGERVGQSASESTNSVVSAEVDAVANRAVDQMLSESALAQDIFKDFEKIIEGLDSPDPYENFDNYERFVYRQQARELLNSLDFQADCIRNTLDQTDFKDPFSAQFVEELLEKAQHVERTLRYCQKYKVSEWVKNKLLELMLPFQKHHIFSDKSIVSEWTREFQKILDKYGLGLNEKWNFVLIPHTGPHHKDYHEWALDSLKAAHKYVQSQQEMAKAEQKKLLLEVIKEEVILKVLENPLIIQPKWYKFWRNDKLQADFTEYSLTKEEITDTQL